MLLQLRGIKIPRKMGNDFWNRTSCTLQLPENWCNDFWGFLMCTVLDLILLSDLSITMKQVTGGSMDMDSQHDVIFSSYLFCTTWVGYVSFGSLKNTTWWDETYNKVSFSVDIPRVIQRRDDSYSKPCKGFGVRLVPRISGSGPAETSTATNSFSDEYTHKFKIVHDSMYALQISSSF